MVKVYVYFDVRHSMPDQVVSVSRVPCVGEEIIIGEDVYDVKTVRHGCVSGATVAAIRV